MKYLLILLALLVACSPAQPSSVPEWSAEEMAEMEEAHANTMEKGLVGGSVSKYYDWDKALFDEAIANGKVVYLEFSASWCPTCVSQEPHLVAGFSELNNPNVVGFKIPYKDDKTTAEHSELARQYGIAYQHTKVILKDGKQVLKSPEAWDKDRFLEELRKVV